MASLPLSAITALFRTGDSSVVSGSYRLERDAGIVRLSHYGTLIATVDGSTCAFHGSSASDRDAANSLFELMGASTRVRYERGQRIYHDAA